jgi:hypothetical protein
LKFPMQEQRPINQPCAAKVSARNPILDAKDLSPKCAKRGCGHLNPKSITIVELNGGWSRVGRREEKVLESRPANVFVIRINSEATIKKLLRMWRTRSGDQNVVKPRCRWIGGDDWVRRQYHAISRWVIASHF